MKTKNILAFLFALLLCIIATVVISDVTGFSKPIIFAVLTGSTLIVGYTGILKGAFASGFSNLTWEDGVDNMPGFTQTAYIGLRQDITTWAALAANKLSPQDKIRLYGNFAMEQNKYFWKVYSTKNKSTAKAEIQGEDDCRSFKITGKLFYPGTEEECRAFAAEIKNQRGVVILIEPNGERLVVGTEMLPVYFKPTIMYGESVTGEKGMTLEFEADSNEPGYTYHGTIPISGSTLPAIS